MSVINNMLNEDSKETKQRKVMEIELDEIYTNPLNKAPMINIQELVATIKEQGLQTPIQVYKKENHHYVLINGERRFRAVKELNYLTVPVMIIPKPKNEYEERMLILDANTQRDESNEYKHLRAKEYEEIFYKLKESNAISPGMLKIDWIGNHMNVSGRQVQRYLETSKQKKASVSDIDRQQYIDLQEHMQRIIGSKVKFKKNSFTISYLDVDDLNRILDILHLENVVNE